MRLGTPRSELLQPLALFLSHSLPKLGWGWERILQSSKGGTAPKRRKDTTNTPRREESQSLPGTVLRSASHCRLEEVFANHVQLCPRLHYPHLFFQDFLWHDPLSLDDKEVYLMSSSYFPITQHRVKKLTHFPGPLVGRRWKITKSE